MSRKNNRRHRQYYYGSTRYGEQYGQYNSTNPIQASVSAPTATTASTDPDPVPTETPIVDEVLREGAFHYTYIPNQNYIEYFQSITASPNYGHNSFEELRWEHYQRKNAFHVQQPPDPGYYHSITASEEYRHLSFEEIRWMDIKLGRVPKKNFVLDQQEQEQQEEQQQQSSCASSAENTAQLTGAEKAMEGSALKDWYNLHVLFQKQKEERVQTTGTVTRTSPTHLATQPSENPIPEKPSLEERMAEKEENDDPTRWPMGRKRQAMHALQDADSIRPCRARLGLEERELADAISAGTQFCQVLSEAAKREGYYCIPPLESLEKMTTEELRHVKDFTVGRYGYGEVRFHECTDLSDMDIHRIMGIAVVLDRQRVCVYPEEREKWTKHQGLNKPATVLLQSCFLLDSETQLPITDPDHPEVGPLIERLRSRPGLAFLKYDVVTGDWVFRVSHF
ncbi:hypothetical protein EC973_002484 [Apophysomyces ossiformis]|uniref:Peptidase S59 domain-containing protein n=1 Tax=Apophysomyces ossiformis TaxID=679940 RepID=A0A8H7ESE9_9FUNG|nr:hypothetical protein EC973_002484 [Apophysomyces ossiformis]